MLPCPPDLSRASHEPTQALLVFNQQLIEQALALVVVHAGPGRPLYEGPVGSHLRHVVEHFEALLFRSPDTVVDYDARPRDAALETSAPVARRRLGALHLALSRCTASKLDEPLQIRGRSGLEGELAFEVRSSLGRELAFLASHTIHHFALLAGHCRQHDIPTPEGFGKAPATRAHERALQLAAGA